MACESLGEGAASHRPDGLDHSVETRWLRSILSSVHEAILVVDPSGPVLEANQAFTDMFGYSVEGGPIMPPYPWWPTEEEDIQARAEIRDGLRAALAGAEEVAELRLYTHARQPRWVACADAHIMTEAGQVTALVRTFRDITPQKVAQCRRSAAAAVAADLSRADNLETVLGVARHGFELLFDGRSTIQVDLDERYLFSGVGRVCADELTETARIGLAGTTSCDGTEPRPGILILPAASTTECRVWVQFPQPRRVDQEEMIAADLFAQAFGLAIDRVIAAQRADDGKADLQRAVESHERIGQAVGILVERYRIPPDAAFDRLREASQNRNLKLREIAARVTRTGADPEQA